MLEAGRSARLEDQPGLPNEMEHQFGALPCLTSIVKIWVKQPKRWMRQGQSQNGRLCRWHDNNGWFWVGSNCDTPIHFYFSPDDWAFRAIVVVHRPSRSMDGKETSWMPMLEAGRSAWLANDNKTLIRSTAEYWAWSWFRKRSERRPRGDRCGPRDKILVSVSSCAKRERDRERDTKPSTRNKNRLSDKTPKEIGMFYQYWRDMA